MLRRTTLVLALRFSRSLSMNAPAIEVERKFAPSPDLADRVLALGGSSLGAAISFRDTYYDTPDWSLTTRDIWLRRREDRWELKVPSAGAAKSGGETSVFAEHEGEPAVLGALGVLLAGRPGGAPVPPLPGGGLVPFAAFVTTRERWSLPDGTGVDSDTADFGHGVVEIEAMMTGSVKDLAACQDRVVAWMRRLRLTEAGGIRPLLRAAANAALGRRRPTLGCR